MPDQYNATAPQAQAQARDFIVTLDTKGPLATKRHMWNGDRWQTESYGRAAIFTVERYLLSDIRDLANGLSGAAITRAPRRFVIRGDMIPDAGIDYAAAPRRLHARGAEPATLQRAAHHWIALDIDGLACPKHIDPLEEPDAAVEYAVEQLPAEFHSATCFWQFTASQGIKPGLSLRLWFWADRKLTDAELKIWLADAPVDHAIFAPAQPIYTAFPIFEGAPDPVWWRCGLWEGDRDEITPPAIDVRPARPSGSITHSHADGGGSGYDYHRARIGDHPEGRGFFAPIKTAVASFFGRHGSMADSDWLRADLEQAIRSADSSKHDAAYLETRVRDLDPLIEAIRERQAEAEATAAEEAPTARTYELPPAVDVAEGRAQLARIAADFSKIATSRDPWPKTGGVLGHSEPPVIVVNAAPGLGKTRTALEAVVPVVLQAEQNVLIAIPRHDLGDQQVADLAKIGIKARTYRSRGAAAADGAPMCLETKRTGAIEDALGDVSTHACKDGKGNVCEHFATCGWQEQFRDPPDVWLVPHNNLYLKLPRGAASAIPKPDVTVIDENFVAGGDQEDVALDISDLLFRKDVTALYRPDKDGKVEGAAQLRAISERVHAVLAQLRGHVRIRPDMFGCLTADEVRAARRLELKRKKGIPDVVPGMPPDEATERALRVKDHNQEVWILAKFWEYLAATLEDGFDESLYLRFSPECRDKRGDKTFPGVVISSRLELHKDITSRPVLHLDGTANETVVRRFFPHARFHTINVQMPTTTTVALIQITDRAMSKGNAKSAKLLEEYRQYIDVVAADARGTVGVICLSDTEIALKKQAAEMPFSPNVLPLVHYGATTGMNAFSDVSDLILIGRLEPPPYEMEKAARLLFKRPVAELPPPYYPRMARGMAMRGSDRVITVRGSYHPDEGVEALRWLACEGGQLQAVHRGRPINRGPRGALRIHIVSNVYLPIEVDFARTWDELRPSLAETMLARGYWVSSHADMAAFFPDLFGNAAAAKTAMARARVIGNEAYRVSLIEIVTNYGPRLFVKRPYLGPRGRPRPFVAVQFRRVNTNGRTAPGPAGWLIFDPERFPDPAALLREKLGCDVVIQQQHKENENA